MTPSAKAMRKHRQTIPKMQPVTSNRTSDDDNEGRNRRVNDTDGDVSQPAARNSRILYNLAACLTLVRRTKEIDSINHVQMRSYAPIFPSLLVKDLPTVSKTACATHLQTSLLNARQHRYKLNIADYARSQSIYSRVSFLAVCLATTLHCRQCRKPHRC